MEDYCSEYKDILLQCPPILRDNISQVWLRGRIGIMPANIKITPLENRTYQEDQKTNYKDNFKLDMCYAGKFLIWEMLFNNEDYGFAPDFIFDDQTFLNDPDIDVIEKHLPSLANWDIRNSQSLINVITELLQLFKYYQILCLKEEKFSRIYAEYENLANSFNENEMEIFVDQNNGIVQFLFKITVNYNNLPPYIDDDIQDINTKVNPGEAEAILQTTFMKPDCTKVQTKLQLSPCLEQVLGNSTVLHIPAYNRSTNLADYVLNIKSLLEEKVEQITNQFKLKNEYISGCLALYRFNVIEYDNRCFNSIVLLFEIEEFYTLVYITIGNLFPKEKPKVTLRSICKQMVMEIDDYPYSPRWKPEEMVNRLTTRLTDAIQAFNSRHARF